MFKNQGHYAQYYAFNIMIMLLLDYSILLILTALLEYLDLVAAKHV